MEIINKNSFHLPFPAVTSSLLFLYPFIKDSAPALHGKLVSVRDIRIFVAKDPRMTSIPENSWLHSPRKSSPGFPLLICFPEVLWVNMTMSKLQCPGIQSTIEHYRTLPIKKLGTLGGTATQQNKFWFGGLQFRTLGGQPNCFLSLAFIGEGELFVCYSHCL